MGYSWNGVCYPDTAAALSAFALDIPTSNPSGINAFTAAPTINGTGLISWSISNRPFSGSTATTRTGTTQLLTCSEPMMNQWPLESILLVLALFFAAFGGFRAGYRP